jgi:GAF domain-containing protein
MQPIFDAILDSATRLCRADISSLRLSEVSGVRRVALRGDPLLASQARSSIPVLVRLAASRIPTHIPDLTALEGDRRDAFWITIVNSGLRTALVMPVLKDNEIVGTIALGRKQVQPFTDKQISLFRDFAAQAAIALESTRRGNIARCRARWRMPTASLPWASSPCRLLMKSSSSLRRHAHKPLLHSGF